MALDSLIDTISPLSADQAQRLRELDVRLLDDIGITLAEARREGRKRSCEGNSAVPLNALNRGTAIGSRRRIHDMA